MVIGTASNVPTRHSGTFMSTCPIRKCIFYYRCKNIDVCFHTSEICDGEIHYSRFHNDEQICDVVQCFNGCTCRGLAVSCEHKQLTYLVFIIYLIKAILYQENVIATLSLKNTAVLLWLDMSSNKLAQ